MPATDDITIIVAEWVKDLIDEGITATRFSAAVVARLNSINITREMLSEEHMNIYVTGIDADELALRGIDLGECTTLVCVAIAKPVKKPDDNAETDPLINQVGAIYRWFVKNSDHQIEGVTRRLDKDKSEIITLLDDSILREENIATGGFVLAFIEERETEEEDP